MAVPAGGMATGEVGTSRTDGLVPLPTAFVTMDPDLVRLLESLVALAVMFATAAFRLILEGHHPVAARAFPASLSPHIVFRCSVFGGGCEGCRFLEGTDEKSYR